MNSKVLKEQEAVILRILDLVTQEPEDEDYEDHDAYDRLIDMQD
mgnify:CR=1 FL=1